MECPLCLNAAHKLGETHVDGVSSWDCPQCGRFKTALYATKNLSRASRADRSKVSAWLGQNTPAVLTAEHVEEALRSNPPSIHMRAYAMLKWLSNKFPAGRSFDLKDIGRPSLSSSSSGDFVRGGVAYSSSRLVPIGWCRDTAEMGFMLDAVLCKELGWLSNERGYQLTAKGLLYLEREPNTDSAVGFCAMWFSDEVKPLWSDAIEPAIRDSGYESLRIDGKQHNGKIDDEIVASIRSSKFVVADYTGNRGGVYYEAGLAHGLGLPVIFMCRKDQMEDIHFDVRQYNCILWKEDELQKAQNDLKNRILATLGQGPLRVAIKKASEDAF
jgi:hypothetical protein